MPRAPCLWTLPWLVVAGCATVPDVIEAPQLHNPFPQLRAVAVLPFSNQSDTDPTLNGDLVANLYATQLQQIPGFEVVPVGVVKRAIAAHQIVLEGPPQATRAELRRLGRALQVDVVVVGSVTDFTPYYPPRMGLAVNWYAVNPAFHPIPPGYGLPWGTPEEEFIPDALVREAEFALAREQLKTQTPPNPEMYLARGDIARAGHVGPAPLPLAEPIPPGPSTLESEGDPHRGELPPNWPTPNGFIPPLPSAAPPPCWPQTEPIISHVRQFNGSDGDFTTALAHHFYLQDDARFGGWQTYLQRSEDFMAFCCRLHIAEMLAARGGAGQTGVVYRWPIRRYER